MAQVWRIANNSKRYPPEDLSGAGAAQRGGRWNPAGRSVVYSATTISLACLETLTHTNTESLPLPRCLIRIDIPDDVWIARETLREPYPLGWDEMPPRKASIEFGNVWLASNRCALLEVPSVIIPEETNILINPLHPDAKRIVALNLRPWKYDERLSGN